MAFIKLAIFNALVGVSGLVVSTLVGLVVTLAWMRITNPGPMNALEIGWLAVFAGIGLWVLAWVAYLVFRAWRWVALLVGVVGVAMVGLVASTLVGLAVVWLWRLGPIDSWSDWHSLATWTSAWSLYHVAAWCALIALVVLCEGAEAIRRAFRHTHGA